MHYVRLLRAPKLVQSRRATQISLVLAITTDLGDSLLEEAIELIASVVVVNSASTKSTYKLSEGGLRWNPKDRVLKPLIELPPEVVAASASGDHAELCIGVVQPFSADSLQHIWASTDASGAGGKGLVMPVWVAIKENDGLCSRKIRISRPDNQLDLQEQIGDSIALHLWDSSPVALAYIAACFHPNPKLDTQPLMAALKRLLNGNVNILELGCGVGIFGAGLTSIISGSTVLMTDLECAEDRARANIGLVRRSGLLYENLDWQDGRHGRFGPLLQSRRWDLVVLSDCTYNTDFIPALVSTLDAVKSHNASHNASPTKVFLATKQRHGSEQLAWQLLARDGWRTLAAQTLKVAFLGKEDQSIELYLFEKS